MSSTHRFLVVLAVLAATVLPRVTNGQEQAPKDPETIKAIIHDIQAGWENADGTPFRKHFLDFEGARYVESGGQNEGLKDLVEHHVEPEGDALQGLTLVLSNIEVHFEGLFAWAIADVVVKATIKSDGSKIDKRGYETFLFRYVDGSWKVVHTHSSTRSVRK